MDIIESLKKSRFRSSFHLNLKDKEYVKEKGMNKIREHAIDFIDKRIRVKPKNDGRQTPWAGHPVFISQHATATCCRSCIEKWYKIPKEKELSEEEVKRLVEVIIRWIKIECDI